MGFFEILLIAVVTLLVVGPERMPEAVRTVALTIGRVKRSFNAARREIERQIGADEIRQQLQNEEVMHTFSELKSELSETEQTIHNSKRDLIQAQDESLHTQASQESREARKNESDNEKCDRHVKTDASDKDKSSVEKNRLNNLVATNESLPKK